jgi:membrane protease YdiL (CAAX protease family)
MGSCYAANPSYFCLPRVPNAGSYNTTKLAIRSWGTDAVDSPPPRIASRLHLAVLLWVLLWIAVSSGHSIRWIMAATNADSFYFRVTTILMLIFAWEWIQVFYVWFGVAKAGVSISSLIGGSWSSVGKIAKDFGIGIAFWAVWIGVLIVYSKLCGPITSSHGPAQALAPRSGMELALWIAVSVSAGFCEEILFRGYLQRQFLAMSNSMPVAIIAQALLFGVVHLYQGAPAAISIAISAVFLGWLAAWRRSLRPGMVAHAWYDAVVGLVMYFAFLHYQHR